ncbi:TPA: hypothetical protein ACH3X1_014404 [Trebouxia sp. C0004]
MGAALSHSLGRSRRPWQVQQCARLMSICGRQLQEPNKCMLASVHTSTCFQHPFCTEIACGISSSSDSICKQQLQKEHCKEAGPSIGLLADELQKQWHDRLNMHLGIIVIRPASGRKVWWSCDHCPDGFPHIWESTVKNRTYGRGCPFCSSRTICQHNMLARKAPEVATFWDAKKNHPMSPTHVTVCSGMRAHWKCIVCSYEWQASVLNKVRGKTGCPKCARAHAGRKADGTRQKHPTFAAAKHVLLQQWDHDRNRENGLFPDNTTLRSNKPIWWCCHECPKGKVHSWQARAFSRTSCRKPAGCPCCAGHQLYHPPKVQQPIWKTLE